MNYTNRFYRKWIDESNLQSFNVKIRETDLQIRADRDLTREAGILIGRYRNDIENYIKRFPDFQNSLIPIQKAKGHLNCQPIDRPEIINAMLLASVKTGVGPMAAVAGAVSEFVGKGLRQFSREMIIENGGDIYIDSQQKRIVSIFAGHHSPFNNRLGIELLPEQMPLGICTSSGTVGPSISFGNSDAAIVLSSNTPLADALATQLGNCLIEQTQFEEILNLGMSIEGIFGVILIMGERIGIKGAIRLLTI